MTSVYRKFDRDDILFSTIHTRPKISVNYGVNGWEGNTGPSASLSLYGGVRSRSDIKQGDLAGSGISIYPLDPLDTHSIDKIIFVSGSYPSTGSIRFVRCTNEPYTTFTQVTDERWYDEHFRPIELLFDYYQMRDTNYFFGSHDFYSPLLLPDEAASGSNIFVGPHFVFSGSFSGSPVTSQSSSFTAMAWIKPIPINSSSVPSSSFRPTVFSQKDIWNVYIDTDSTLTMGFETGSLNTISTLEWGKWNHIAVSISGGVSASFYINGDLDSSYAVPHYLNTGSDDVPLVVGAYISSSGEPSNGFSGFLLDTQIWRYALSAAEITSIMSGTFHGTGSIDLVHYSRYNDGPFGTAHGFVLGSGALDHSCKSAHGYVYNWSGAHSVHWQPCDHPNFVFDLHKTNLDVTDIRLIHVPSMFYGKQINPGSIRITDGTYNQRKIVRVINDDSRGTLYVSGSMTRNVSDESYKGNTRRKVGNVFYTEGLIVFTDPAFYDMFDSNSFFWSADVISSGVFEDLLSVDMKGEGKIYTQTFNCRMGSAQYNASNNITFSYIDDRGTESTDDDRTMVVRDDGVTYVTAIGLYDDERRLVAVAKLAQPIRKRVKDNINIRLKMDI